MNTRGDEEWKTNEKRDPVFLLTVFWLETTLGTRRRDTPLETSNLVGCHLFCKKWASPPLPRLFIPHQAGQTTWVGGNLKLEIKGMISEIFVQEIVEHQAHVWVGRLARIGICGVRHAFCWHWGRGVFWWSHPPSVCYIFRNHLWLMDAIVTLTSQGWVILVWLSSARV